MMGRRIYRWSNYDYDQSSFGSYSRNRCDSGERQIKYRDGSRDRYNGYYLNKYRERSGDRYRYEKGDRSRNIYTNEYRDRFSEMYRENDRKIVEKKLMKETEDINLRIDISQVMIDGKTLTVAIVDLLQVQNLILT